MAREAGLPIPTHLRTPSRVLISLAFLGFGCTMAYLGASQGWTLALVVCFGVGITLLAFYRLEWAVLGLLTMANFDGFLKPLFAERFSLFLKDYFVLLALVRWLWGLLSGEHRPSVRTVVAIPALLFAGYVVAEMANPNVASPVLALTSLRAWLIWIPLFFIGYDYLRSRKEIERLWLFATALSVPVAIYAIVQYSIGFEHLYRLSPRFGYYAKMGYVAAEGHRVLRVFSTMVHPGALGTAMGCMALVASGLGFTARSAAWRAISLLCVPLTTVALFLSGSRAAMIGTGVGLAAFFVLSRRPVLLIVALALLLGGFWQSARLTGGAVGSRVETVTWESAGERTLQPLEVGLAVAVRHPFGLGASSGVGMARSDLQQTEKPVLFIENDLGRALSELGVGALLYLVLLGAGLVGGAAAYLRLRSRRNAILAGALLGGALSVGVTLAVGAALYVAPGALYFWLALASAMRLPAMEAQEVEAPAATAETRAA